MRLPIHAEIADYASCRLAGAFDCGRRERDRCPAKRAANLLIEGALAVAIEHAGVHRCRIYAGRQPRSGRVVAIELERCVLRIEPRREPGEPHVADAEEHARMARIEPIRARRLIHRDLIAGRLRRFLG